MKILLQLLERRKFFFVIGGMKCGTTSLWHYLAHHPAIVASSEKEPCFFSYNYRKSSFWYLRQFTGIATNPKKTYFDGSPVYLHDPESPQRIHRFLPHAKMVVLLRDPIERAVSHYNYYSDPNSRFGKRNPTSMIDKRSMAEAFHDDMSGRETRKFYKYCRNSLYYEQVQRFLNCYDLSRFHFIDTQSLLNKPQQVLERVLRFLEVKPAEFYSHFKTEDKHIRGEQSLSLESGLLSFKVYNSQDYNIENHDGIRDELVSFFRPDVSELQMLNIDCEWMKKYLCDVKHVNCPENFTDSDV